MPYDSRLRFRAPIPCRTAARCHSHTSYLTYADEARDELDWNPEFSRRARGVATYAALRELGRQGVADLVERCCRHAHDLVMGIGSLPGAEVMWEPQINQGLVRFPDRRPGATDADHDRRTDEVIAGIRASGEAFFGGVTWRGRRCMRVTVCNWRTSARDVERAIAAAPGKRWPRPSLKFRIEPCRIRL